MMSPRDVLENAAEAMEGMDRILSIDSLLTPDFLDILVFNSKHLNLISFDGHLKLFMR
ncbi:MAG: hypothetical protein P8J61_10505 [Gammaproteobacteria bacterium]|jgi:hypothetical protein|nr:hypothetical protein [Gammaproteobacteria bacterium]